MGLTNFATSIFHTQEAYIAAVSESCIRKVVG